MKKKEKMAKKATRSNAIGMIPLRAGSIPHHLTLYLRSSNARPKTLDELLAMNPSLTRKTVRQRIHEDLVMKGMAVKLDKDLYCITEYGNNVLKTLAARENGVRVIAPER